MLIDVDGKVVEVRFGLVFVLLGVLAALFGAMTAVYQIAPEQEGLVLRFGKHIKTSPPGLHFKAPLGIDRVIKVPTRIVDVEAFGYRDRRGGGAAGGLRDENSMLTGDLNIVLAGWDVQFSRVNPHKFVFNVRDPIDTLRDISQSVMREIMGDRASILILTVGRSEIQQRVRSRIQELCDQFEMGLLINEVNLLFVDPPAQVLDAFNDLNKAEQDAVRFFEEASRQYQERVPRARGEAQRMILEAEGFAQRRVNVSRGEAQRFVDMLNAYRTAPEVTKRRLYLETLEVQLPQLREIIMVDDQLQGLLPHLNLKQGEGR
ncbi:MAG TPA: FtsH protease activity modulator HflK [Kiritimatiellia bacterium]|nr:FtsH protease activity modulator HflK [Kiritimatiellia bacterium]